MRFVLTPRVTATKQKEGEKSGENENDPCVANEGHEGRASYFLLV